MGFGNVVLPSAKDVRFWSYDQFLNEDSFSDASATEQANLSTTSIGREEIDDFDPCFENFRRGGLIDEFGSIGVDGQVFGRLDGTTLIDRFTNDVHNTTKCTGLA